MDKAAAWLMSIDQNLSVAVGQMQLVHVIDRPEYIESPDSPYYCKYLVKWNEIMIPVMVLSLWLNDASIIHMNGIVAVAVYKDDDGLIRYGGFYLKSAPVLEYVDNSQSVSLEQQPDKVKYISLSCYSSASNGSVPIVNVSKVFSEAMLNCPETSRNINHA